AEFIGELHDNAGHGSETFWGNIEQAKQVIAHAVETGADENEIGFEVSSGGNQPRFEDLKKFFVARARWHRHIQNFAGSRSFACLRGRTAARIGTVKMRAEIKTRTGVLEGVLESVTVVVIPIHDSI